MITAVDALGRALRLAGPARRVVSLVPSETESVAALGGLGVLVGRSDYCTEPRGSIERIPSCGGTKSIDVARVAALAPDLILVNQEENAKKEVERLIAAGLPVHVSFPHDVRESLAYVETLARLLGVEAVGVEGALGATREAVRRALERGALRRSVPLRVFVPIWMDPLMTFDGRTFASDLLELAGAVNVFGNRPRRYPLAADLGTAPALPAEQIAGRDTRYPRVTIDEVVAQSPDLVLLPSEPHVFTETDAAVFRALPIPAARSGAIILADGMDLFWYGTRLAHSLARVSELIASFADSRTESPHDV